MNTGEAQPLCSLEEGSAWLARLALTDPAAAEQQLARFLEALLRQPPAAAALFGLLEQARKPVHVVEEQMALRYQNKALPLGEDEERCFQQVLAVWRRMGKGYALCARLENPDTTSPDYRQLMATILHRCLYYTGALILEHYRARRELPPGLWLELHGYYETAEEWGIATLPVRDALEDSLQASHCAAAYAAVLLVDIAGPYNNGSRNFNLIRRWAAAWAPLISIHRLDDDFEVPPYVVQLMKDAPLHPSAISDTLGDDARHFDTARLGLQINHLLVQLQRRVAPSQLGLGEELGSHVQSLLERLSRPWTQQVAPRKFRRFNSEGLARIATGFEAMHFAVSGEEFVPVDTATAYSRAQFDALFTFRAQVSPSEQMNLRRKPSYPTDEWQLINQSAKGFRLQRDCGGEKMTLGQLVAVCPPDGGAYLLAQVIWLMQEPSGGLLAGLCTLPGVPRGIGVRHAGINEQQERRVRAFLLPALPATGEEASLVLPLGMYQASRALEVRQGENTWLARMMHVVQRGSDFEQISYQAL